MSNWTKTTDEMRSSNSSRVDFLLLDYEYVEEKSSHDNNIIFNPSRSDGMELGEKNARA
ncbi:hypothetical protein J2TS4_09520 [Paenibacillus sp. J2TS4]|nr:hypothetical protein J2TS4_09520 [Paenibacillus sp. J2TS4]